jgi:hypothetical protein
MSPLLSSSDNYPVPRVQVTSLDEGRVRRGHMSPSDRPRVK